MCTRLTCLLWYSGAMLAVCIEHRTKSDMWFFWDVAFPLCCVQRAGWPVLSHYVLGIVCFIVFFLQFKVKLINLNHCTHYYSVLFSMFDVVIFMLSLVHTNRKYTVSLTIFSLLRYFRCVIGIAHLKLHIVVVLIRTNLLLRCDSLDGSTLGIQHYCCIVVYTYVATISFRVQLLLLYYFRFHAVCIIC